MRYSLIKAFINTKAALEAAFVFIRIVKLCHNGILSLVHIVAKSFLKQRIHKLHFIEYL